MARITWKNVAAPNTGDVVRQQAIASRMINSGAKGIGSSLQALDTNQEEKLSAGAMQQLGQIQDIGKFDELMKNGGLSELGISADRASPELIKMLQGYRDTLEGKRSSDQDFKEDVFQFDRSKVKADQNDWTFARTRELAGRADDKLEQSEKQRLFNERVAKATRELVYNPSIVDEPSLRDAAYEIAGDDKEFADALVKSALGRLDDVTYIDENVNLKPENQRRVNSELETLSDQEERIRMQMGSNEDEPTRLWYQAYNQMLEGDYSNPLDALTARFAGTEPDEDGEERKVYNETAASVKSAFDTLKSEYGTLSPQLISGVMQATVGDDGFIWQGDQLETKLDLAREKLNRYKADDALNELQLNKNAYEADLKSIANKRKEIEGVISDLKIARSKPDPDQGLVLELETRLQKLAGGIADENSGSNSGNGSTNTQTTINQTNANLQRALDAATGGRGNDKAETQSAPGRTNASPDERAAQVYNNPIVESIRGELGNQVNQTGDALSRMDQMLDQGAGNVADWTLGQYGALADQAGVAASLFSEYAGSWFFRNGDDMSRYGNNLGQNGLTGAAQGLAEEDAARQAQTAETLREGYDAGSVRRQNTAELSAATENMTPEETAQYLASRGSDAAAAPAQTSVPAAPQQAEQPASTSTPETAPTAPQIDSAVLNEATNDPIGTLESIMAESGVPAAVAQEVEQSVAVLQSGREIPDQTRQQVQERIKEILARIADERGNNSQDPIAQLLVQSEKWLPF